jgi:uncharacterized membrane protein
MPLLLQIKMLTDLLMSILWSLSPFGEAKVGIPYGISKGLNIYLVFICCFLANVLVFPIMTFFLAYINRYFVKWRFYKKAAIYVAKRAKAGSGANIRKYGFFGLVLFVMVPLPGTGVYAGSIAAFLFGMRLRTAFFANALGIFFSSLIVWAVTVSIKAS